MQADGYIVETRTTCPLGTVSVEYGWQGGEVAMVDYKRLLHLQRKGDVITIGPYRLHIVADDPYAGFLYVMREGWDARLRVAVYALSKHAHRAWHRFIITLAVWGLADYAEYRVPSWRDIHCLRWFRHKHK